jgi:hypothetical protein
MPILSADTVAVATIRVSNLHGRTDRWRDEHIDTHTQEACCMLYKLLLSFMVF